MKRFIVRCVGQFLCVFGLTSIVSDVDAESYSCTTIRSDGSWYAGWATTGVSYVPWYDLAWYETVSFKISGVDHDFSTIRASSPGIPSSYHSTWDLCALPTDGYDYPISGGYQIRPGCALRDSVLYSPNTYVFEHYGCMFVDSPKNCTGMTGTTGTGSGSSGVAAKIPPCCYMSSNNMSGLTGTVPSLNGQAVSVVPIRVEVVQCTFNGCGIGQYYNTRNNTYSTITFRDEPGTFTFAGGTDSNQEASYGYNILTHIYLDGVGTVGSRLAYYYCTTRGCRESSHFSKTSKFDFYDIGHRCSSCEDRYSVNSIGNRLNGNYTATLNWTTPADGTGQGTCRLSSYQWTDDKGVQRIPCNNATP